MCIAIHKPKDLIINRETLEICYKNNPHGAGYAYSDTDPETQEPILKIQKGFFDFDEFYTSYVEHEQKNCLIHFRIKTSGKQDAENCHPWRVNEDMCIIHNGTISDFVETGDISDSGRFAQVYLIDLFKHISVRAINETFFGYTLTKVIGNGNKVVFLNKYGEVSIINDDEGTYHEGCWYSNFSFQQLRNTTSTKQNTPQVQQFIDRHNKRHMNNKRKNKMQHSWALNGQILSNSELQRLCKVNGVKKAKNLQHKMKNLKLVIVDDKDYLSEEERYAQFWQSVPKNHKERKILSSSIA